ncbi:uncharacterized protein LOC144434923 [Glandiceps talaboti]
MDISTDSKALTLLLSHLRKRYPESVPIYNLVRHVRDKKWDRTEIFVDNSVQDSTTVFCHSPTVLSVDSNIGCWYSYSEDEDKLLSILNKIKVTERRLDGCYDTDTVIFMCLNDKFLKTITQYMMTNHGFEIDKIYTYQTYVRTLDNITLAAIQQQAPVLPKGYRMASLKPEHAELVASKTGYNTSAAIRLVRKLIEEFPSVAIYIPNQDEPVSWAMLHQHGNPGYGYTQPTYRSEQLQQIGHAEMMSRLHYYGYQKVCFGTTKDNIASQKVIKKYPGLTPLHVLHNIIFKKDKSVLSKL